MVRTVHRPHLHPANLPRSEVHGPAHRPSHRPSHRLIRWQRLGVYCAGAVLLLTGVLWLALHYSVGAGSGEMPHPLEAWSLRLHGLAGFASLFMFGVLGASHVPHGWRLSARQRWTQQRNSGLVLCLMAALLVLSGYLLYYFAPEALRPALGWAHALVGIAISVVLLRHRRGA